MRLARTCILVATTAAFFTMLPEAHAQPGKRTRAPKAAAAPLDPEAAEDAKLRSGIELVEARDTKRAISELERLHAATKKPRAIYWLARAHQDAGHNADALRAYKRFLREGGATIPQSRSVEVLGHVQTLTMQVAIVTVTAPAGATIMVDDTEVGDAPLAEPLYVDPGKHTVALKGAASGKTIDVAEESRTTVDLGGARGEPEPVAALAAPAPPPPSPPTPVAPPSAPSSSSSSATAWTVGGLGLATLLAGGSVYFTVKALGTASDFDAKKGELGTTQDDLDGLQGKARLQSGLAVGLGVAALATAGVTLFVLRRPSGRETRVVGTGNGFALTGGF